jgi:hypothetical protein
MFFKTVRRAIRALAPQQPQPQPQQPAPLMPAEHRHLLQVLHLMAKASHRRQVLELAHLAALLPLERQAQNLLVEESLQALRRLALMPSPRNSASRAQTVRSIRSRRRRR